MQAQKVDGARLAVCQESLRLMPWHWRAVMTALLIGVLWVCCQSPRHRHPHPDHQLMPPRTPPLQEQEQQVWQVLHS